MPEQLNLIKDELFENIFNFAKGGIAIVSPTGKWLKVNQSIVDMLGYSKDEIYGLTFQDITHRDDLDLDMNYFNQMLNGTIDKYDIEKRYFHKNGSVIWGHLNVSVFKGANNKLDYFIVQIIDITIQKENALQNNLLADIIQEKNDQLNDFARIATHDLRSHVGNLGSITEFMEEEVPEISANDNFIMWKESIKNLQETLQHLDEIRTDQHFHKNSLKSLPLFDYVNQSIYNVTAIARKHDVKITNTIDKSIKVLAIEAYLDSIILNFLTNAIKYRSDNRLSFIGISSRTDGEFEVIDIKDNGIGIDLEQNGNAMFTLNATFSNHKDSRGIGLFITKNHIESIGGKIEVQSDIGKGTCFSIYLKGVE